MVRLVLPVSLGLALLSAAVGHLAGAEDKVEPALGKPDLALVVNLHVNREERYAKTWETVTKVKDAGATHVTIRVCKVGEEPSAEVVAQPHMPSKRIAAVVAKLLDSGVAKISVHVKK
jgi:hypothetical protein